MSASTSDPPAPLKPKSGVRTALEYTGIPPSWFNKRPKLPSRNWLIFLSVTSSLAGLYIYDRQQCKKIKREYIDRVKYLADEPLHSMALARKVKVYGSKWPGDDDFDQNIKYFKKYVKPYLVAAAVDYDLVNGKRHGDLANRIADEIKAQRRVDAGIDVPPESLMPQLPAHASPEEKRRRELDGGIVVIGRQTLKEFMAGLKRGWTESLEKVDKEEFLSKELELDGKFDEVDDVNSGDFSGEPIPTPSRLPPSPVFSPPLHIARQQTFQETSSSSIPVSLNTPPTIIPALPPLLLVPFVDYIGFTQIPIMLYDFFCQRYKVRTGAQVAYALIKNTTRPAPEDDVLDFDRPAETFYKRSLASTPADIEKARTKYYEALPAKLETARALARGIREPSKDEIEHPPPTEVELRAERMKKELRWRGDTEGWEVIKPESDVAWDERFNGALRVFTDPVEDPSS